MSCETLSLVYSKDVASVSVTARGYWIEWVDVGTIKIRDLSRIRGNLIDFIKNKENSK
jgi:hypothetical protein